MPVSQPVRPRNAPDVPEASGIKSWGDAEEDKTPKRLSHEVRQ